MTKETGWFIGGIATALAMLVVYGIHEDNRSGATASTGSTPAPANCPVKVYLAGLVGEDGNTTNIAADTADYNSIASSIAAGRTTIGNTTFAAPPPSGCYLYVVTYIDGDGELIIIMMSGEPTAANIKSIMTNPNPGVITNVKVISQYQVA